MINVKRVYEPLNPGDGKRFLVDRVWPRGLKKEDLQLDGWLKDAAPSAELRRWFGHDPDRWPEFQRRYLEELRAHPEAVNPLVGAARRGPISLLFAARDTEHNNAVVLKAYLDEQLG
jgi:uncharacterized protein YeaO (DUF488 family)